jgi:hypothetical protein
MHLRGNSLDHFLQLVFSENLEPLSLCHLISAMSISRTYLGELDIVLVKLLLHDLLENP